MPHPYQMARQRASHSHLTPVPDMPATKIFWDDDEKRKVAAESYRLLQADNTLSNMAAIEQAQRKVLSAPRRRDLGKTTFQKMRPWILDLWAEIGARASKSPNVTSTPSPVEIPTVVSAVPAAPSPSEDTAVRPNVRWTEEEQRKLAARVYYLTQTFEDMSRLDALRKAMESELPADRYRPLKAWSQVSAWLDPMIEQCALDVQLKQAEEQEAREREAQQRQIVDEQRRIAESRIEEEVQRRVEAQLEAYERQTRNVSLDSLVRQFADRLASTLSDAFSASISKALGAQLATIATHSMHTYTRAEDMPHAPPKDRLPRVTVVGLLRQQEEDVEQAFKGVIDFVFVKSMREGGNGEGGAGMLTKSARSDLVIAMVDHCGHDVDASARHLKVPYKRLGGKASHLKRWLTEWLAGENAPGVGQ